MMPRPAGTIPVLVRQSGASLLIGLIILSLLTVLGLVSTSGQLLQQKSLAAGMDHDYALYAAEQGLRWGQGLFPEQQAPVCAGQCGPADLVWAVSALPADPAGQTPEWWHAHALDSGNPPPGTGPALDWLQAGPAPDVIIEHAHESRYGLPEGGELIQHYYRVYAAGYGVGDDNPVILAAVVAVPYLADEVEPAAAGGTRLACNDPVFEGLADAAAREGKALHCGSLNWRQLR